MDLRTVLSLSYLILFMTIPQFIHCQTSNPEVAVIIGGTNKSHDFRDVEVYSYLNHFKQNCLNGKYPRLPDFPIPIVGASSVYVPQKGIYVCGGVKDNLEPHKDCYRYDPREDNE